MRACMCVCARACVRAGACARVLGAALCACGRGMQRQRVCHSASSQQLYQPPGAAPFCHSCCWQQPWPSVCAPQPQASCGLLSLHGLPAAKVHSARVQETSLLHGHSTWRPAGPTLGTEVWKMPGTAGGLMSWGLCIASSTGKESSWLSAAVTRLLTHFVRLCGWDPQCGLRTTRLSSDRFLERIRTMLKAVTSTSAHATRRQAVVCAAQPVGRAAPRRSVLISSFVLPMLVAPKAMAYILVRLGPLRCAHERIARKFYPHPAFLAHASAE